MTSTCCRGSLMNRTAGSRRSLGDLVKVGELRQLPLMTGRNCWNGIKARSLHYLGMSPGGTCLLPGWCPA